MDIFRAPKAGAAYQMVKNLPDEMIRYELETQGIRSDQPFMDNRKALSELIENGNYKPGRQPVAVHYRDDINACTNHLSEWESRYRKSNKNVKTCESYLIKLMFLGIRLHFLVPDDSDEEFKRKLSALKVRAKSLKTMIESVPGVREEQMASFNPKVRTIDDWSLSQGSLGKGCSDSTLNTKSMFKESDHLRSIRDADDSILDLSMSFIDDPNPHQSRGGTKVINSTSQPTNSRNSMFGLHSLFNAPSVRGNSNNSCPTVNPTQYRTRIKMWEWGVKFIGEPNTLPVVEFVRRVKELAKARGASKVDLYDGACDLFEGSALLWYRAGVENGRFHNWDQVEDELLSDFKAYDYGDNMWDYIRTRVQQPQERVVTYFAIMEDLFLKLNRPVTEMVKTQTIRRNLRGELLNGIGVSQFTTVMQLKDHCKIVEMDLNRIQNRYRNYSYREPDAPPKRQVQFARHNKVHMLSNEDGNFSDQSSHYDNVYNEPGYNNSSSNSADHLDSYRDIPKECWENNVSELSIREESGKERFSVPNSKFFSNPNNRYRTNYGRSGYDDARSYRAPNEDHHRMSNYNQTYHAPQRNNSNRSENYQGSQNRTEMPPMIVRRPY